MNYAAIHWAADSHVVWDFRSPHWTCAPAQRQQDPIHFPHPLSQSTTDPVRKDLPMLFFQTAYFMVAWNDYCITVAFRISSPCSERGAAWMCSWRCCIFHAAGAPMSLGGCSRAFTVFSLALWIKLSADICDSDSLWKCDSVKLFSWI